MIYINIIIIIIIIKTMELAILQSIDIFTFDGMVTQKKNEQNEEYVLFKHNDGTETCIFKNDNVSINRINNTDNIILSRSGSIIHNIFFVCCHHFPNGVDLIG